MAFRQALRYINLMKRKSSSVQRQFSTQNLQFKPNFKTLTNVQGKFLIKDFEKEVGVYSATPEFVKKNCGPIANMFLSKIPQSYFDELAKAQLYPNIDVRIHRLYPGDYPISHMYPAFPGWHCDGEYRETYFGQPDLQKTKVSHHIVATASSYMEGNEESKTTGVSNTQFLTIPFNTTVVNPTSEITLWRQVHENLMKYLKDYKGNCFYDTKDGEMILFDSSSLHRAMPTKIRGWRMFFRMAGWHKPNLGDGGMISKQETVYIVDEAKGW
ncbi:MAG: hypothetical protein Edafosvirus6_30 [Edafosvirus sp.]|uniref:Phytanoyl-CoA dioxygenase n=1 Tax=Edafosvirus sp. TaxID=2487765 RepID=A0A3G4ZW09_9VIRU|nr:MAG: hypothetical protein Edafosvirus6_30 [Edafosvirus sp.]